MQEALPNYLSEGSLLFLILLVYKTNAYYLDLLSKQTQTVLTTLGLLYLICGLPYHLLWGFRQPCKSKDLLRALKRYLTECLAYLRLLGAGKNIPPPALSPDSKVIILFMMVKFFFLPLMLNFTFDHIYTLQLQGREMASNWSNPSALNSIIYRSLTNIFFFIDTLFFTFGYMVESRLLGNQVRSVEPTWFGWTVALMCYPPFNSVMDRYIPWPKDEMIGMNNLSLMLICRILIVIFTFIYLWATLALGAKCSNLTNRGIVSRGPYRYVRHPAYVAKNITWWIMTLPILSWAAVAGGICWSTIYFLRAITEEMHLIKDPDYQEYCRKVRWRFIPFVY